MGERVQTVKAANRCAATAFIGSATEINHAEFKMRQSTRNLALIEKRAVTWILHSFRGMAAGVEIMTQLHQERCAIRGRNFLLFIVCQSRRLICMKAGRSELVR